MKALFVGFIIFGFTSMSKADLVKHHGYLKSVNPATSELKFVLGQDGRIDADDVEIISANLVKYKGYLYAVNPITSGLKQVIGNSESVDAEDVSK